ncbi:histidine decarboxylase [Elongatibacter sediminis]|uniref:Histidine decarboxylase n=1 Tax=Elongatibacter sediminis TaxID=3119006 RepID=A0AAW9RDM0_9GAMM
MQLPRPDQMQLDQFLHSLEQAAETEVGYPGALDLDYRALAPFLRYCLNNIGDPFGETSYRLNSHAFEREVVTFYAGLTEAPEDGWWGYVSNGGTEGNLYGLYLARERYPDGIAYFSQDSHYSVAKNLRFLNMRHIMIRSQPHGEIDYEDLRETIRIRRDVPPIVFANIGTTMKEARDDITRIRGIMEDLAIEQYYIHSDAALCGGYAAWLEPRPNWNFADGTDSIAISGHKFLGAPVPCGIVLARREHVERISHAVAYIGSVDTTISGSRNGLASLIFWYAIRALGEDGMKQRLHAALEVAAYAEDRFRTAGIDAWRNPAALSVIIPQPAPEVCTKWQLASSDGISHVMCMPHVTRERIDSLLRDIETARDHAA